MKTKLIKRTLAAIAVLAFGLAFVFAAVTGKTGSVTVNAAEGVKGYNVYNVNNLNTPNSGWAQYIKSELLSDETYGYVYDFECLQDVKGIVLRSAISYKGGI